MTSSAKAQRGSSGELLDKRGGGMWRHVHAVHSPTRTAASKLRKSRKIAALLHKLFSHSFHPLILDLCVEPNWIPSSARALTEVAFHKKLEPQTFKLCQILLRECKLAFVRPQKNKAHHRHKTSTKCNLLKS